MLSVRRAEQLVLGGLYVRRAASDDHLQQRRLAFAPPVDALGAPRWSGRTKRYLLGDRWRRRPPSRYRSRHGRRRPVLRDPPRAPERDAATRASNGTRRPQRRGGRCDVAHFATGAGVRRKPDRKEKKGQRADGG